MILGPTSGLDLLKGHVSLVVQDNMLVRKTSAYVSAVDVKRIRLPAMYF